MGFSVFVLLNQLVRPPFVEHILRYAYDLLQLDTHL